jgi:hypothetical protein
VSAGTFLDLSGPPFTVQEGSTYALSILVPASMSPADVSAWLSGGVPGSAPSSSVVTGQAWQVTSVHPGSVSGALMGYTAIATWQGATGTQLGSAPPGPPGAPEYTAMAIWAPAGAGPPLPPPPNAPLPFSQPPPTLSLSGAGMAVFGLLGAVLGAVAGHFAWTHLSALPTGPRPRGRRFARKNPLPRQIEVAADDADELEDS